MPGFGRILGALGGGAAGFMMGGPMGALTGAGMGSSLLGGSGGRGGGGGGLLGGGRPGENPANMAQPYLDQIDPMARSTYQPYIDQGRQADTRARDIYSSIPQLFNTIPGERGGTFNDPRDFLNKLIEGYEPSTGYKYNEKKMLGAARNSAASGGILGTQFDQENQQDIMRGLLGQDQQQYLSNIMDIIGSRAGTLGQQGGYESGIGNRGAGAADNLANILAGNASQRAGLQFQGQRQNNADRMQGNQNRNDNMMSMLGLGAMGMDRGWFGGMGNNSQSGLPAWRNPNQQSYGVLRSDSNQFRR